MKSIIPEPMIPKPFRIHRKLKETHDTYTIELESTNGADGFPFSAGQFNMLYVFGVGEVPISISGDPSMPKMLKHTTRSVGTVTKAILKLRSGDVLGVRGPFGSHWPVNEAVGNDVVIVAGGIGLAPLRPVNMARLSCFMALEHLKTYFTKKNWKAGADVLIWK